LFAHFFTVDLFALFSFGFHFCLVGLVRFTAGFFLFGSCFFADFLATNGADVVQDGLDMFRSQLVKGFFHILVDVATVDSTFN